MIGINELIIYLLLQIIPSTIFLIRCIEILKIIKQKNQEITKNQLFILYIPIIGMIWVFIVISIVIGCLLYIKGIFFAKFILGSSQVIQQKLI